MQLQLAETLIIEVVFPVSAESRSLDKLEYLRPYWISATSTGIHLNYTHFGYSYQR